MKYITIFTLLQAAWVALAQSENYTIREDTLGYDSALEVVHIYNGQWPTGIAVSKTGRKFSCYPGGLDILNTNTGLNNVYQVSELTGFDTETAFPNASYNNPPGGAIDLLSVPTVTKGLSNYLLGVQSVVIDYDDVLWILDTGRVQSLTNLASPMLPASPGGTKLISVDLTTNTVSRTYVFPTDVAKPDSYFNDVRIDTVRRFAYISDSSDSQDNALVVLNLATGESWRVLQNNPTVTSIPKTLPFVYGEPLYQVNSSTAALDPAYISFGVDGIALSPDTNTLYYSVIGGRFLYSLPTALLRDNSTSAVTLTAAIQNLGEKGISDGLDTDSVGTVYAGNVEQSGVSMYNPVTEKTVLFTRDKRINWVDTFSVGTDGYLYFTVNQLNFLNAIYPGEGVPLLDRRQKPYVAFRKKLPLLATKGPGS